MLRYAAWAYMLCNIIKTQRNQVYEAISVNECGWKAAFPSTFPSLILFLGEPRRVFHNILISSIGLERSD